jgi:tRNA G46 methylase TrmB
VTIAAGGNSASVRSNQQHIHRDLDIVVARHARTRYRRPIGTLQRARFEQLDDVVRGYGGPLILDSGCGTGASTRTIAAANPRHLVIGIDKSEARLGRSEQTDLPANCRLIRGDCRDFWRLAASARWPVERHYLLYPNPWPKAKHLLRRWHAHPVFSDLIALGGDIEVRTNWQIYAQEFARAVEIRSGGSATIARLRPEAALSPFEAKYCASGHAIYQVVCNSASPEQPVKAHRN